MARFSWKIRYDDRSSVHGCEIDCSDAVMEDVGRLVMDILAVARDGKFSPKSPDAAAILLTKISSGRRVDLAPGEFAIQFVSSWLSGKHLQIFSCEPLGELMRRMFG
jgi:hypothetical protein